jgi:hypothetical protein
VNSLHLDPLACIQNLSLYFFETHFHRDTMNEKHSSTLHAKMEKGGKFIYSELLSVFVVGADDTSLRGVLTKKREKDNQKD